MSRSTIFGLLLSLVKETSFIDVLSGIVLEASTIEFLPFAVRTEAFNVEYLCNAFFSFFLLILKLLEIVLGIGERLAGTGGVGCDGLVNA